ncbi:MAG TPA: hypothetical protein VHF24_08790 [Acidimicrobiales bacterium]|nr:hypothetical protein [Acidimicrobiales bacterium]
MAVGRHHLLETTDRSLSPAPHSPGTALVLAAAAGLHLAAFFGHLPEGAAVAPFFLVAAGVQLTTAAAVRRGIRATTAAAFAVANAGLIVVWAVSRTAGLPGVHAGAPEPIGLLDTLTVVTEAVAVFGLLRRSRHPAAATGSRQQRRPAVVLTASFVAAAALLLAPSSHGDHDHEPPLPPAVARVDVLAPAPDAPEARQSHHHEDADATSPVPGCGPPPECTHPHGHDDHSH